MKLKKRSYSLDHGEGVRTKILILHLVLVKYVPDPLAVYLSNHTKGKCLNINDNQRNEFIRKQK